MQYRWRRTEILNGSQIDIASDSHQFWFSGHARRRHWTRVSSSRRTMQIRGMGHGSVNVSSCSSDGLDTKPSTAGGSNLCGIEEIPPSLANAWQLTWLNGSPYSFCPSYSPCFLNKQCRQSLPPLLRFPCTPYPNLSMLPSNPYNLYCSSRWVQGSSRLLGVPFFV